MIYEKELSERIIGFAFKVYNELGKGFLEKVYENSLVHLMRKDGINCKAQLTKFHRSPSQCSPSQCSYSWEYNI